MLRTRNFKIILMLTVLTLPAFYTQNVAGAGGLTITSFSIPYSSGYTNQEQHSTIVLGGSNDLSSCKIERKINAGSWSYLEACTPQPGTQYNWISVGSSTGTVKFRIHITNGFPISHVYSSEVTITVYSKPNLLTPSYYATTGEDYDFTIDLDKSVSSAKLEKKTTGSWSEYSTLSTSSGIQYETITPSSAGTVYYRIKIVDGYTVYSSQKTVVTKTISDSSPLAVEDPEDTEDGARVITQDVINLSNEIRTYAHTNYQSDFGWVGDPDTDAEKIFALHVFARDILADEWSGDFDAKDSDEMAEYYDDFDGDVDTSFDPEEDMDCQDFAALISGVAVYWDIPNYMVSMSYRHWYDLDDDNNEDEEEVFYKGHMFVILFGLPTDDNDGWFLIDPSIGGTSNYLSSFSDEEDILQQYDSEENIDCPSQPNDCEIETRLWLISDISSSGWGEAEPPTDQENAWIEDHYNEPGVMIDWTMNPWGITSTESPP